MKNILIYTIVSVLTISGFSLSARPQISIIGRKNVDLGNYPANIEKTAVFTITNKGDANLEIIRIRQGCSCSKSSMTKKQLAPGETAELRVIILPCSIFGKFRIRTFINSNDPEKPFSSVTILGNAIPLFSIKPSDKFFAGYLKPGTSHKLEFKLTTEKARTELGTPDVKSNYPATARIEKIDALTYKLITVITPEIPKGSLDLKIYVPVNKPSSWKPLEILVSAKVGRNFHPVPNTLYFKNKYPVNGVISKKIRLFLVGEKNLLLDPKHIVCPKINGVQFSFSKRKGNSLTVTATFSQDFIKRLYTEKKILLKFLFPEGKPAIITCVPEVSK